MSDKETMIVAQQAETHVYAGDTGYIVIKQIDYPDGESFIFIDPQNAEAITAAIKAAIPKAREFREEWRAEEGE